MSSTKTAIGVFSIVAASLFSAGASAEWRIHPDRCPGLVAHHKNPAAAGPEPIAVCPASAWQWHGDARHHVKRPAPVSIYYNSDEKRYYRHDPLGVVVHIPIR